MRNLSGSTKTLLAAGKKLQVNYCRSWPSPSHVMADTKRQRESHEADVVKHINADHKLLGSPQWGDEEEKSSIEKSLQLCQYSAAEKHRKKLFKTMASRHVQSIIISPSAHTWRYTFQCVLVNMKTMRLFSYFEWKSLYRPPLSLFIIHLFSASKRPSFWCGCSQHHRFYASAAAAA